MILLQKLLLVEAVFFLESNYIIFLGHSRKGTEWKA